MLASPDTNLSTSDKPHIKRYDFYDQSKHSVKMKSMDKDWTSECSFHVSLDPIRGKMQIEHAKSTQVSEAFHLYKQ